MAIDNGKGLRGQYGLHAGGLLARETHGDEAGPPTARGGATRAHVLEDAERKLHEIEYCRAGRHGVMNGGGRCHNGNRGVGDAAFRLTRTGMCVIECEQISEGEHLGGEKTIESAQAESAAAAKKIRDMRGLESGLAGEESSIHTASIDPPKEFQAETLLQLGEVHCGKLASR